MNPRILTWTFGLLALVLAAALTSTLHGADSVQGLASGLVGDAAGVGVGDESGAETVGGVADVLTFVDESPDK